MCLLEDLVQELHVAGKDEWDHNVGVSPQLYYMSPSPSLHSTKQIAWQILAQLCK